MDLRHLEEHIPWRREEKYPYISPAEEGEEGERGGGRERGKMRNEGKGEGVRQPLKRFRCTGRTMQNTHTQDKYTGTPKKQTKNKQTKQTNTGNRPIEKTRWKGHGVSTKDRDKHRQTLNQNENRYRRIHHTKCQGEK